MTEQNINNFDQEDEDTGSKSRTRSPKALQAFRRISRELTEEDLANPVVQKLMVDNLYRLEEEKEEYRLYMERFHEADKKVSVLEEKEKEKSKTKLVLDILSGTCLTFGGIAIGQINSLWPYQPSGWIIAGLGMGLLAGGIAAQKVKASL